jgi:hypothetical protein
VQQCLVSIRFIVAHACVGGVAPSPTVTSHHPAGGGPAQFIRDTLAGPAAEGDEADGGAEGEGGGSSSGSSAAAAGVSGLPAADLSSILPRDDAMVYGGEAIYPSI